IAVGQTFSDHESNIHITTVDVSSTTPKYVDVVVNMGAFPDNHSPTLALSASAQVVPTNATVIFTATASDPDGDVLAYAWQHFGDTNVRIASTNSSTISRTFPTQGIYVVSCTVSDMKGGTATRNQLIMVGNGGGRFTISGRVTSGGTGVPNVIVNANGGNAVVTDTDGHYIIPNLSANTYSMTPLLYGQTFSEVFNNSVTVGPSFTGADFVAEAIPRVSLVAATATAQEPGSGTGVVSGVFTITRTGDTSQPLTVFANALGGTATLASDYTYLPTYVSASQGFNTFTIPEESATLDIVVTPQSDAAAEGPETVVLQLGPGNGYVVTSPSEGSITINDDPLDSSLPKVSLSVTAARTFENSAVPARIRFARTGQPTAALAVNYSVTGTATGGVDYPSLTGSVTIPIGAAAAEVEILSLNDSEVEAVETVTLTATADPTYLIQSGANSGTVTIADDDVPTVTVIAPDTVATEVDLAVAGAQADTGTFVVSRTGNTSQPLTVYYALSGPTAGEAALHGVDYEALAGVVVIPAGAESTVISIIPRWDNLGEGTEWVTLNLGAGPTNYKLGNSNAATVELRDAITNPATVEVIGFTPTPAEPSTNGSFRFTVRAPTAAPLTVNFTLSGSASVNSDYSMTGLNTATLEGSVTITPSVTAPVSQNVTVTIVNDGAAEDLENLTLTITPNAAYQTFGPTGSATLWMKDDDQATVFVDPHVTTYPPAVAETAGAVAFYLSRTGSTTSALTVNYLLSGTALNGVDYDNGAGTALSGSAVIPVGSAGVDVTVRPVDDGLFEGAETIVLTLAPGNYGLGPPATLYLSDNEAATQTVAFESSGNTGSESVSSVSIPVSLSAPATAPVSVEYMVDSGTRTSTTVTSAVAPVFPYWVRVERVGTVITSYQSPDGVVWTQRGSANTGMSTTYTAGLAVTSGQSGVQNTAVFDNVSVANLSVGGAAGSLTAVTVGTVNPAATNSENSGVYTISAGGGGIGGTADAGFRYLYFPISNSANCAITARVVSQTAGSATRAGVMIRQSTATNSMFLGALTQLNGALLHYSRMVTGGGTSPATFTTQLRPLWVRLQRAGNLLTASQSPDGVSWTTVGSPQTMALPGEVLAGLAVSARNDSLVTTATFDNVSLTGEPVLTGRTVGYVNSQGSDSVTGGVHTVSAGGALIGGLEDECHFVAAPMTGDFTLRARVVSHSGGAANAQAGVMVRENGNYRSRSVYVGSVANAAVESISRNGSVSTAFGSGVDYSLPMGVLNFGMGEMTQNIVVDVVNDTLAEPDEVFAITLRNANGAQIGSLSQFTYALLDDESTPPLPSVGFALSATSVAETEAAADLTVTLSGASAQPVSVDCAVTGGTATAGSDFVLTLSGITFAPGETVKQIPVALWDDALLENSETMTVTLGNAVNATLGSQLAHTLTLIDDEFPVVTVVATDPNAAEAGLDEGTFTFYRTGPTTSTLTVNYGVGGTAVSGSDRQDIGTSVTFAIGSGTALRQVTPLGDVANEGPETVILTVGPDAAYTVGAPSTATVTIADDDRSTVTIVADDPSASETTGNPGRFTVTRTVPTTAALNVPISISGTATNGTDYATISTTVSFTAGQSSRTINVVPVDDGVTEGPEVVTISLGSGLFQSGTSNFANVTIEDNDSPPTIFISSPGSQGPLVAGGNGVMLGCTVSDDGAPQPVTLTWTQAGGPGLAVFEAPTQSTT
ncbi:MAG TPA: Calx-beta domain-containing protein, partial [Prosthecobacter sp.]|nr:Calx-beta domain-containing protein [Prosthecobacter sp.]